MAGAPEGKDTICAGEGTDRISDGPDEDTITDTSLNKTFIKGGSGGQDTLRMVSYARLIERRVSC